MSDQFNDRNRFRGRYEDEDFDYEGGYGRRSDFGRSYRGEYDYGRDYGYGRGGTYGRGSDFDRDYGRNYGWNRDYGSMTHGNEYNQDFTRGQSYNRGSSFNRGDFDRDYGYNRGSSMRDYNRGSSFDRGRFAYNRDYDFDYDYEFDEPVTTYTYYEIWMIPGPETGRGPQGYHRSDDRIREDVSDRLMQHGRVDASNLTVDVANGEVTLNGSVHSRQAKRMAEDVAESVLGVTDVHNNLKVQPRNQEQGRLTQMQGQSQRADAGSGRHPAAHPDHPPPDREQDLSRFSSQDTLTGRFWR